MSRDLDGYQADVPYPSQFNPALTPGFIAGALALQGWKPPDLDRSFRFLDLGCGDGLSTAASAASHPDAVFEGVDGLDAHIAAGRAFPGCPPNLALRCETFDAHRAGGPDCDFVIAHGVIAWVSERTRANVFEIAARRVRPGGVFAVSYNAMPGSRAFLVFQRLLNALARNERGNPAERFERAFARVEELAISGAAAIPMRVLDTVRQRRQALPADFFAHEYLNEHWHPLWSNETRSALKAHGFSYAGQSGFGRLRPELTLRTAHRDIVDGLAREEADSLIDLFHDAAFRIDLYIRAPEKERDRRSLWLLAEAGANADLSCEGPAGRLSYDNPAAREVFGRLQDGAASFRDLVERSAFGEADVTRAVDCLLIGRQIQPCAPPGGSLAAACRFNAALIDASVGHQPPVKALAGVYGAVATDAHLLRALAAGNHHPALHRRGVPDLPRKGEM